MSDAAASWCLIESDPGVFTELIRGFGVTGAQIEELYCLEAEQFNELKPVHGLIFLFKWQPKEQGIDIAAALNDKVYFAAQVIQNACATIAIVNLLLNLSDECDIKLGSILKEFHGFSKDFDHVHRGICLGSCDQIRSVHNSFARQHFYEIETKTIQKEDSYHFVSYVPVDGHVFELDGLKEGPIDLGPIKDNDDWIDVVRPFINARIQRYSEGEIHFNLLAVISDRRMKCEKRMQELLEIGMESEETASEIMQLEATLAAEEEKNRKYKRENIRRRHNYTPFIVQLLRILARENKLIPLVKQAKEKLENRKRQKADAKVLV